MDASEWEQYKDYMSGILKGDFGPSFRFPGRSVSEMIATGLPVTFELAFYAILIALLIGVFSGVLAALKRNTLIPDDKREKLTNFMLELVEMAKKEEEKLIMATREIAFKKKSS